MKLSTKDSGLDRPKVPGGLQHGVLSQIIDLGTQETEFEGVKGSKRQLRLMWEFPHHTFKFDEESAVKRLVGFTRVTMSAHPKSKLFKILTDITGTVLPEDLEMAEYIGLNALINVVITEKGYANLAGFNPLMLGTEKFAPETPKFFDLDDYDEVMFEDLGAKTKEVIALSPEYKDATAPSEVPMESDAREDETPF
jgi:hypothetical protein